MRAMELPYVELRELTIGYVEEGILMKGGEFVDRLRMSMLRSEFLYNEFHLRNKCSSYG